jgi:hypothetical protein
VIARSKCVRLSAMVDEVVTFADEKGGAFWKPYGIMLQGALLLSCYFQKRYWERKRGIRRTAKWQLRRSRELP